MSDQGTILVQTTDATPMRGRSPKELQVDVLAENVNLFLLQVQSVIEKAPDEVGKFGLTKFVVNAEISANGKLVLMGSGVEAGLKGGLTFEFERK